MSKNDITGDNIKTKSSTEAYRNGHDRIFGKKEETELSKWNRMTNPKSCEDYSVIVNLNKLTQELTKNVEPGDTNTSSS